MKRFLLVLFLGIILATNVFAADINDFIRGDGSDVVKGSDDPSDLDTLITNYLQDPLDKLLTEIIHGCTLTRTSATVITVSAGEVTCYNAAQTIKRMRRNTSTTTVNMAVAGVGGIDSGSAEGASTWYSVYAVADADATTFTAICTEQGTAPSDVTYYRYIGSFYNDSGQDILNFYWSGEGTDIYVGWDVPISITTTASANTWSGAISCAAAMPSSSTRAYFRMSVGMNVSDTRCSGSVRPHGGTWQDPADYATAGGEGHDPYLGFKMPVMSFTDSSQQINHFEFADGALKAGGFDLSILGYWITR